MEAMELKRKPSKLPKWLAILIQKYLWIIGLLMCFGTFAILFIFEPNNPGDAVFAIIIAGLIFFILDMAFLRIGIGADGRDTREYLLENNEYDISTPRKYTSLCNNFYVLAASNFRRSQILEEFIFNNGNIYVKTKNGSIYEAPLSETNVSYQFIKGGAGGDVFIFVLESNFGDKIKFSKADSVLEDKEWEDIYNILIRGKFLGETKGSKRLGKILSIVQKGMDLAGGSDFSASSISSDALDKVKGVIEDQTKMKILGNYNPTK